MVAIPKKQTTLNKIEEQSSIQLPRPYLGMSGLGHSCSRFLWYSFRWCYITTHEARILRLFSRGDREEDVIIKTLESAGIRTYDTQLECIIAHGHSKGHCDGKCIGVIEAPKTEHLAEFKTMNDKYFKEVCKIGVQAAKPVYYGQCQLYMRHLDLTRTLFVAVNKNDDAMYIERIKLDKGFADELTRKAEDIILSEKPPEKQYKSTWYECKYCDAKDICHKGKAVEENCRTCEFCDILPEGKWECSKYGIVLATEQQRLGCKDYVLLEYLKGV